MHHSVHITHHSPVLFLLRWFTMSIAVAITAYLLPGVRVESAAAAVVAALLLGIVNAFVKPVLLILTLPITIVTFGLFALVINAALILLVAGIVPGFVVAGFWWAILFSMVLAVIGYALREIVS